MDFKHETGRIYQDDADGKLLAEVTFPVVREGVVDIDHTFVDDSLRGQGIAGQLMEAAYEDIKRSGFKAVLTCPYAVTWFGERPEREDIIA
jgi:predicted GNAT family acetyltransferase